MIFDIISKTNGEVGKIMYEKHFMTKSDWLYENLKNEILDGKLRPGERLIVADVANKFEVSPMPVRESLKRLQQEGLIEMTPHIGAKVNAVDMREFEDIVAIRVELESMAAKLAAGNFTQHQKDRLFELIDEMKKAAGNNDPKTFGALNQDFHHFIYDNCGNGYLGGLINELWGKTERTKGIFVRYPERMAISISEHEKIAVYIDQGDAEGAYNAFKRHKRIGFEMVKSSLLQE